MQKDYEKEFGEMEIEQAIKEEMEKNKWRNKRNKWRKGNYIEMETEEEGKWNKK